MTSKQHCCDEQIHFATLIIPFETVFKERAPFKWAFKLFILWNNILC